MIINLSKSKIPEIAKKTRLTLVDGSFDPLHHGHIAYFEEALLLGNKVGCLIAPDSYTSKKHKVLLKQAHRATIINSIREIDYVFIGEIETSEAIKIIRPNIFFKGSDWKGKLPRNLIETCKQIECEIVFGSSNLASSSEIIRKFTND